MSVATRSEELEAAAYRRSARLTGPQGPIPLSPALWLLLAVVWGCAAHGHVLPVEPGVTFAAHEEHDGLVIDKMEGGEPAFLGPPGWFHRPGRSEERRVGKECRAR